MHYHYFNVKANLQDGIDKEKYTLLYEDEDKQRKNENLFSYIRLKNVGGKV